MADDILTKDRNDADIALAAKDIGGIKFPRNILTSSAGVDLDTFPVSALSLPLPTGAAAEVTLASLATKLDTFLAYFLSGIPHQTDGYLPTQAVPAQSWRCGFDKAVAANGVDSAFMTLLQTGTGMGVSQSAGNFLLTSGTTANSETIARSTRTFSGNLVMRYSTTMTQRILQNNFYIELVDVIGDGLAYTINSATSVTVTIPGNPFTSANVGQSMWLGAITGAAGLPNRFAIASVSGSTVTFTVASWPASGSGTLSLFGWNYHQIVYQSTTATSVDVDCSRNGYASGVTAATINTTASTHVGTFATSDSEAVYMDQVGGSATGLETTRRASRVRNVPDVDTPLYLQLRARNGTTNPATTTTWTVGVVDISNFVAQSVSLAAVSPMSANSGMPVEVVNTPAVTVSSGTLTTVSTVTAVTTVATVSAVTAVASSTPVTPTQTFANSAASTNATSTKASAGTLWSVTVSNINVAARYLKLYNKASAPTVGTDVPVLVIPVAAGGIAQVDGGATGIRFGTGIAWALTGLAADSDTTAVSASEHKVAIAYT